MYFSWDVREQMHLNVCQYSVQRVRSKVKWKLNMVYEFPSRPHFRFKINHCVLFVSSPTLFPVTTDIKTLKAHSMFVYKASWMYILYIVDLPNVCSVSEIMLSIVVWDFAPLPPGCVIRTFVCAVINVFSCQVLLCLSFPFPFFFFLPPVLVLDKLAYDGLSFRNMCNKSVLSFVFCPRKALWMS